MRTPIRQLAEIIAAHHSDTRPNGHFGRMQIMLRSDYSADAGAQGGASLRANFLR
jgi:hypothetical protein